MLSLSPSLRNRLAGIKIGVFIMVGLWLALLAAGTGLMLRYESSPGASRQAPTEWPVASTLPRIPGQATLIMLAHPKCPCTAASLDELAALMAENQGRVTAQVLFLCPEKAGDHWRNTVLWRKAGRIPGVTVSADDSGAEAARFGGETSGDVLLYDAAGRLAFHGGITAARGLAGENSGHSALTHLLAGDSSAPVSAPVFGCPLNAPTCTRPLHP